MKRYLFFLFFTLFAIGVKAQCEINKRVFDVGERLTYKAYYNWNFIWLEAADVWFNVSDASKPGYFDLEAIGTSLPKYDWLYKVRDTFRSRISRKTMLPYYFLRDNQEGSYLVHNEYIFDHNRKLVYTDIDNSDFGKEKGTLSLKPCTFDVLSAIYYTRSLSFDGIEVNDTLPLRFLIDNEYFDLFIRYLGKETITTREDKTYNCIKFSILLVEGTIFKGGEDMTVWATDDENHIPVLVEAKIVLGSVKAYLTGIENNKFPVEALVE